MRTLTIVVLMLILIGCLLIGSIKHKQEEYLEVDQEETINWVNDKSSN